MSDIDLKEYIDSKTLLVLLNNYTEAEKNPYFLETHLCNENVGFNGYNKPGKYIDIYLNKKKLDDGNELYTKIQIKSHKKLFDDYLELPQNQWTLCKKENNSIIIGSLYEYININKDYLQVVVSSAPDSFCTIIFYNLLCIGIEYVLPDGDRCYTIYSDNL